jgi:hypothetical protein
MLKCIEKKLTWHTLHQVPKESTFPVEDLMNPAALHGRVATLISEYGVPLERALRELKVPTYARKYFGPDGRFKYRPEHPIQLSVENGDEELLAAKIHFDTFTEPEAQKMTKLLLSDYLHVLKEIPRAQLLVVLKEDDQKALELLLKNATPDVLKRVKTVPVNGDLPVVLGMWSQDGSKPIRVSSGEPLQTLVPIENKAAPELHLIWNALGKKDWPVRRSIFQFEGGDVVVGQRHVFVGPQVIEVNMYKLKISRAEVIDGLSAEFGKPVFEIKKNQVPLLEYPSMSAPIDFHVDMFLAVARNHKTGKETVLLSSPELGIKALMGKRKASSFSNDWQIMSEELVRGAKTDPHAALTSAEESLVKTLKDAGRDSLHLQQDHVNAEAIRLRSLGYEVKFVPSITRAFKGYEEHTNEKKVWEIFNYTNSIFSGKKAIIPELGIPSLDRAATQVFEKDLGYDVIHVHSPTQSLCLHGGIRCMTETYRHISN